MAPSSVGIRSETTPKSAFGPDSEKATSLGPLSPQHLWILAYTAEESWPFPNWQLVEEILTSSSSTLSHMLVCSFGITTAQLSSALLSFQWLSDKEVDCVLQHMGTKLSPEIMQAGPDTLVLDTFWHERYKSARERPALKSVLQTGNTRHLVFLHCSHSHWVAISADVKDHTVEIYNSLVGTILWRELESSVMESLNTAVPNSTWIVKPSAGWLQQKDSHSCGLAMLNAVHHIVSPSAPVWNPKAPVCMTSDLAITLDGKRSNRSLKILGLKADIVKFRKFLQDLERLPLSNGVKELIWRARRNLEKRLQDERPQESHPWSENLGRPRRRAIASPSLQGLTEDGGLKMSSNPQ
ncbi:hypothetical protein HD554DRAFT_2036403 [Boletus coccyginus]|nr:hypothetical protein HD554DRAFT_2036403 [Boletus coccyginus]